MVKTVKRGHIRRRNAFTMIELIFAIVVIAVSVMSLPVMTQITSQRAVDNIETDEAIFEAQTIAFDAAAQEFDDIAAVSTPTSVLAGLVTNALAEVKYNHRYTISVTHPASFGEDTNATGIKKIGVTICKPDVTTCSGNEVVRLYNYRFDFNRSR